MMIVGLASAEFVVKTDGERDFSLDVILEL